MSVARQQLTYNVRGTAPIQGLLDLQTRVLRCPLPAMATIAYDPVRCLRAVRLACQLDFALDSKLDAAIMAQCHMLHDANVSFSRIELELSKMFAGPRPLRALQLLCKLHLIHTVMPTALAIGIDIDPVLSRVHAPSLSLSLSLSLNTNTVIDITRSLGTDCQFWTEWRIRSAIECCQRFMEFYECPTKQPHQLQALTAIPKALSIRASILIATFGEYRIKSDKSNHSRYPFSKYFLRHTCKVTHCCRTIL
jgi:tRNA nucleotidyltransferase/poly(A) polymerase